MRKILLLILLPVLSYGQSNVNIGNSNDTFNYGNIKVIEDLYYDTKPSNLFTTKVPSWGNITDVTDTLNAKIDSVRCHTIVAADFNPVTGDITLYTECGAVASYNYLFTSYGYADSNTTPTSTRIIYDVSQVAVSYDDFPGAGGVPLSVSGSDLTSGIVRFAYLNGIWNKYIVPIDLLNYVEKDSIFDIDTIYGPNLFDGLASYGTYWNTTLPIISSSPLWARTTHKIKALPNTTYSVIGIGSNRYAVFYNAAGGLIGSNFNMTTITGGYKFTTPALTDSMGINLTTTGETGFETTFAIFKSETVLPYDPPNVYTIVRSIKPQYLTNYYNKAEIDIKFKKNGVVIIDTPYMYVRTVWDDTTDLVERLSLNTTSYTSSAKPVNFWGTYLIDNSALNTADDIKLACNNGELIHNTVDDVAPAEYNGGYIGANHGFIQNLNILATSHGKTVDDIGSIYTDATSRQYKITNYIDGNNLYILSNNTGVGDLWNFDITPVSPLTWSSGGVNHGNISFTTVTQTQLWPSLQDQVINFFVDDIDIGVENGVYYFDKFEIEDRYSIPNLPDVWNYVVDKNHIDYNNSSIAKSTGFSYRYVFDPFGGCEIEGSFRNFKEINLNYAGFTQSINLFMPTTSDSLYVLLPDTQPFVGVSKTWDFALGENATAWNERFEMDKAHWTDTNVAPYRFCNIMKRSNQSRVFFTQGYSADLGITALGVRKNYVNSAGFFFTTKKMYPKAIDSKLNISSKTPVGYRQAIAYRSYQNPFKNPNAKCVSMYRQNNDYIVSIDYDQNVTMDKITLPEQLSGYKTTAIRSSGGISLNSTYVDNGFIYLTSTGTKQQINIKLSK